MVDLKLKFNKRLRHRVLQKPNPLVEEDLPQRIIGQNHLRKMRVSVSGSWEPTENLAMVKVLLQNDGNQSQAARSLGINRVTVWNRMKKYGIDLKRVMTT